MKTLAAASSSSNGSSHESPTPRHPTPFATMSFDTTAIHTPPPGFIIGVPTNTIPHICCPALIVDPYPELLFFQRPIAVACLLAFPGGRSTPYAEDS